MVRTEVEAKLARGTKQLSDRKTERWEDGKIGSREYKIDGGKEVMGRKMK